MSGSNDGSPTFFEFLEGGADSGDRDSSGVTKNELVAQGLPKKIDNQLAISTPSLSLGGKSESVGTMVTELVASPDFLKSFSDDLGAPGEDEGRDEFIERGKELLRNKLRSALDK